MKRKVVLSPVAPLPDPRLDLSPDEKVRGTDDRPIKLGSIVKRERTEHPMYGFLPKVHGRVVRIYRMPGKDRILVDIINKRGHVQPVYLDTLSRSASKRVPKWKIE